MRICPCIFLFHRDSILRSQATRTHTQFCLFCAHNHQQGVYIWSILMGMSLTVRAKNQLKIITGAQYDWRLILLCLLLTLYLASGLQQLPVYPPQDSPVKVEQRKKRRDDTSSPISGPLARPRLHHVWFHYNYNLNLVKRGKAKTHKTASVLF